MPSSRETGVIVYTKGVKPTPTNKKEEFALVER